jgi:hypothetical protein
VNHIRAVLGNRQESQSFRDLVLVLLSQIMDRIIFVDSRSAVGC